MAKLWLMTFDFTVAEKLFELDASEATPNPLFGNVELFSAWAARANAQLLASPVGAACVPEAPSEPLKLHLDEPGLAPNFLDMGFQLVSALGREAMQADDFLSWFPVDTSSCSPEVQALDYKLMRVKHSAPAIDIERSDGEIVEIPAEFGVPAHEVWMPPGIENLPNAPPARLHWRDDLDPPAPIFLERLKQVLLVTEELAQRVVGAGIEDIVFIDYENDGSSNALKMRA